MIRKLLLTLPVITSITLAGSQLTVAAYAAEDDHADHTHETAFQAKGKNEHESHKDDHDHEESTTKSSHKDDVDDHAHGGHEGHGDHEEEMAKGPNGGRLLEDGNFALELTLFESGLEPEFRVFAFEHNKPVEPDSVELSIQLTRLDGQVDQFTFTPKGDHLQGSGVVVEPHSFDVSVTAKHAGQSYQWAYENYEGRTNITQGMAGKSGIDTEIAGATTISESLTLTGRVQTVPNRVAQVRARFPGIVQKVHHNLGDKVKAGDVLARIQSNESLQTYSVKAPINGVILNRNLQIGATTSDDPLFLITDLSEVWVELDVFSRNAQRVKTGQDVRVETLNGEHLSGRIDWVSPLANHASQSIGVRVVLNNENGLLRPGQFVRGLVTIAEHQVDLAVRKSAIQRFRDFDVVFAQVGDNYEVRMLELGRQNQDWAEVTGGLKPGTQYVTENSYLIKADIEKSGASHDH